MTKMFKCWTCFAYEDDPAIDYKTPVDLTEEYLLVKQAETNKFAEFYFGYGLSPSSPKQYENE